MAIRFRTLLTTSVIVPLALAAGCSAGSPSGISAGAPAGIEPGQGGGRGPAAIPGRPAAAAISLSETGSTLLTAGSPRRRRPIAALSSVPATSSHHVAAQIAAVRIRVWLPSGQACVSADDLREAGHGFSRLTLDQTAVQQVTAEVLRAALNRVLADEPVEVGQLLGCELTERSLRFGLERSYRAQAQLSADRRRRTMLVDPADDVRPSTWS